VDNTKLTEQEQVQEQKLDAGKYYKQEIDFQGEKFTPHRLSIGEKRQVAVLKSQRTQELKLDLGDNNMAYFACWLDVALKDPKTGTWNAPDSWNGAEAVYDDLYIIKLYNACWEAVEGKFFRTGSEPKPDTKQATDKADSQAQGK
jgi:hypothetical protein